MRLTILTSLALTLSVMAQTRVACVGDSITFGSGIKNRDKSSYPAQLGTLLGDDYEVRNFGISSRTMLNKGDYPYTKERIFKDSLEFKPDIVIIKLGTNDSKPLNWKFKAEFAQDTKKLVKSYQELPSKPRVILCQPVPVFQDKWGITEKVVRKEIAPLIRDTALEMKVELFDFHPKLINHPEWLPDDIHPNALGAEAMASSLSRYITTNRDLNFKPRPIKNSRAVSNFHGYPRQDFDINGAHCTIVSPKVVAKGSPWVWRARFWGHEPQFDVTMLELGWHVVFCDVADLFGAPESIRRWNDCYQSVTSYGLSKKPFLEGMSRGGLPIHNWAVANPKKVAGIYGDNCVMDFKSWPAGFGESNGDARSWTQCKKAYKFSSDAKAKAYKKNPVDTINKLKKARIPLLYLINTADKVVPGKENSQLAAKRLGKTYAKVILKKGLGHHPHSLPNPEPIVDFALRCFKSK